MYKRILLKLSGEALKGDSKNIVDEQYLKEIAKVIKDIHDMGTEVAVVVGAGNIWRGKIAESIGLDRVPADFMGMIGTVVNAVCLSSALKNIGVESIVTSAVNEIDGVVAPYSIDLAKQELNKGKVVFLAGGTGKPYFTTDTAATMRAIELKCDAILMGKNGVEGIYDSDPRKNPNAKFIKDVSYDKIISLGLEVMDLTAVELIKNTDIQIRVFSMNDLSNFGKVIAGEDIGTTCHK